MTALIYKPTKNPMQSGIEAAKNWVLCLEAGPKKHIDPIMGWTGGSDMNQQVKLTFASAEEAINYAQKHNITYSLAPPKTRRVKPKSYAANFV